MEPLTWATVAALVVNYGIPFTERMIALWEQKAAVSMDEFQKLKATVPAPGDALATVARNAGVTMDDPRITALAALIAAAPLPLKTT